MKTIKQYIEEGLRLSINKCIPVMNESLRIGINDSPYIASPTTWDELRQIILDRYEEQGPGTKYSPIDFNDIDVSEMTTFYDDKKQLGMFEQTEFEYIDISNWNVSNIEDMRYTFINCQKLKSIGNISNWEVSKVKSMSYMFSKCFKLESIGDISKWNISNVKYMGNMFRNCENLTSVGDLSNWNTSNLLNIEHMFNGCKEEIIPDWYKI